MMQTRELDTKLTWRMAGVALLAASLGVAVPARASAQEKAGGKEAAAAPEAEAERKNSVGLFLGATIQPEDDAAFTIGLDYERRLSEPFGVGLMFDKPFGGSRSFLVVAGLFWHPTRAVRLDVAPGIEVNQEEDEFFALRLGADYDFELNERWSLAPNVNIDFVDGRTIWVIGAELGYRF